MVFSVYISQVWIYLNDGTLEISKTVTTMGSYAFLDCEGFTGPLTIPNSVTIIQDSSFNGCSGLTESLIIPNDVTEIGSYAFNHCQISLDHY